MLNSLIKNHRCIVPSAMIKLAYALACLALFCPHVTGAGTATETTCSLKKALRSGSIFDVSFPSLIHDYSQPWADPRNAIPDSSYHDNPMFAYALGGNRQCVLQTYGGLDLESIWLLTITSEPLITTPTLPRMRLDFSPEAQRPRPW